ncbi:MAG: hypothetical protein Q9188_006498 [Gyalolechia gomerana]
MNRSFFNSLQRISQYNYKPSLEDISRASNMNHDVQGVIITKKSGGKRHNYRFVDAVNSEVERSQWVYSSPEVSLVVQIGNAAAYDISYPGIEPTSTFKEDLTCLEQICSSRWLANTPVLVLLSNARKTVRKLRGSHSQLSSDIGELQSYIRDSFLRVDRKYDMRVWVEYLETDDPTSVGRAAIGIIDKILIEQSVLMYGVD